MLFFRIRGEVPEMHDWTFVADQGPNDRRFLRPAWFQAWDIAYGDDRNWYRPVHYITVAGLSDSYCVLPLAEQRAGPFQFASLCGTFLPFRAIPYCGDPSQVAAEMATFLGELEWGVGVRFGPTPDRDPLLQAVTSELTRMGWRMIRNEIGAEFILENPGDGEKYSAALSNNRRRNCERYWRKLCEKGPSEIHHFHGCPLSKWIQVFQDVRIVEAASWVAKSGEPRFIGQKNEQFWETLVGDPWFRESFNVWLIYHDGEPVSFNVALDAGGTRYEIANSFDERVAKYSTGTIINMKLIQNAFSRGIQRINSGLGDSGYKANWGAKAASTLVDMYAFSPRWTGSLAYLAAQLKSSATFGRHRNSHLLAAAI